MSLWLHVQSTTRGRQANDRVKTGLWEEVYGCEEEVWLENVEVKAGNGGSEDHTYQTGGGEQGGKDTVDHSGTCQEVSGNQELLCRHHCHQSRQNQNQHSRYQHQANYSWQRQETHHEERVGV